MLATAATAGMRSETDGGTTTPSVDTGSALVVLKGDPLATSEKTKPANGKKIDFNSTAVKNYRAQLSAQRNDFKQWLRANTSGAQVTGEFDIALNAVGVKLNGTTLGTIASAPMVASAQLQAIYRPLAHQDPDLQLIHAFEAWQVAGGSPAAKGDGVKVAIVDTGIDVTHPCFNDAGYPSQQKQGPAALTNNKVIVAKVFNNKAANKGWGPQDLNGHGTHVSGTVACNEHTHAVVDGVDITEYEPSGVAPRALLGNYNVFPGDDADARSEDIVDALEEAYEDGFQVANMSLGGDSQGNNDLLAMATDNLDRANMVVAVAAGNSGPGFSTIESPGKAARALTAGASTVGHFIAAPVTSGSLNVPAVAGDFPTVTANLTLPLGVVTGDASTPSGLSTACNTNKPAAGSLTDKIALISRGACTFSEKIRNAQDAGADAVLVVNNTGGDATAMGLGGIPNEPTVPAYMVSLSDGNLLKANNGVSTTISATKDYFQTPNSNIMAGFSSWGPTDVDFRVKPDVVAPGVNVLSSQPRWTCNEGAGTTPCWAFFQGTSMATPHLAGIAAVVRGQHPAWTAAQIRSAIVNQADQGVLKASSGSGATVTDVNQIGSGRANAQSATLAKVALDPVSVSFGAVPSGSGQSLSSSITLSDLLGAGPYTASVTNQTGGGVTFAATVSGNTVTVTMTAVKGAAAGSRQGILRISSGGEVAHAAVYALIK